MGIRVMVCEGEPGWQTKRCFRVVESNLEGEMARDNGTECVLWTKVHDAHLGMKIFVKEHSW